MARVLDKVVGLRVGGRREAPGARASEATRRRLIMSAGPVFARRGYREATVREICATARANVAAVNYHFGGKKGLYHAVIAWGHQTGEALPKDQAALVDEPREALRVFCVAFVKKILSRAKPEWHGKLMAREMAEPTQALDEMVRVMIRPHWERLSIIVAEILGPGVSAERVRQCTQSVISQLVFLSHARPVLHRLFPQEDWSEGSAEERGRAIAAFSLAALDGMRREAGAGLGRQGAKA